MRELHKEAHLHAGEHHARLARLHKGRLDFHKGWLEAHQPSDDDDEQGQFMAELHKTLAGHHEAMFKEHTASAEFHAKMAKAFVEPNTGDEREPTEKATLDTLAKAVLARIGDRIVPTAISAIVPPGPGGIRPITRAGQPPIDAGIPPKPNVSAEFERLFSLDLE